MDNTFLQRQVDNLQKQIDAICSYYGICLEHKPSEYIVSESEEKDEPVAK